MGFNFKRYRPQIEHIVTRFKEMGKSKDETQEELTQSLNRVVGLCDDPIDQETYHSEMTKLHREVLEAIYG